MLSSRSLPEHVQNPDCSLGRPEKVRPLVDTRTHEKATVGAPTNTQLFTLSELFLNQILSRADKIVEHVLFVQQPARVVPVLLKKE